MQWQASRLSYHPGLVVWGANNENEVGFGWYDESRDTPQLYAIDYAYVNPKNIFLTIGYMNVIRVITQSD